MESERYDTPTAVDDSIDTVSTTPVTIAPESTTVIGYAVVWGAVSSKRRDGSYHVYERGSLTWTPDVLALANHVVGDCLARQSNGTLKLVEDEIGVRAEIQLDDTQLGKDTLTRVRNRLLKGMSFSVLPWGVKVENTSEPRVLRISNAVAWEVSLTADPAMADTTIVPATDAKNLSRVMQERTRIIEKQIEHRASRDVATALNKRDNT